MHLTLLALRDILTNWDHSPELNAARYHEIRQDYWHHDRLIPKRIVPSALAREILAEDPEGVVFFIQFKTLPAPLLDRWTLTPEYSVVWPAGEWPRSVEYRITSSETWLAERAIVNARIHNEDRLTRMAKDISTPRNKLSIPFATALDLLRANGEEGIIALINYFNATHHYHASPIKYEPPYENPQTSPRPVETVPQPPQDPAAPGA